MSEYTTIEKLQGEISTYGAVLQYKDKVLYTEIDYRGGYQAKVFEFIETPEETGFYLIECRLNLIETLEETFPDNGSAIAWCLSKV